MDWHVLESQPKDGLDDLLASVLHHRGYKTSKEIDEFFHPVYYDPFLIPDMKEGIDCIVSHRNDPVLVFADFDSDGLTSGVMMTEILCRLGYSVHTHIPERSDGHGLRASVVSRYKEKHGIKLVITTDCGSGDYYEVEKIKKMGVDAVITDHHESYEHIADTSVINPNRSDSSYPSHVLSGAGVVFKIAQVLGMENSVLDLAVLGTIADVMPLREENRRIILDGIPLLSQTHRVGLQALYKAASVRKFDAGTVSWYLAPRLNSANRLDSSRMAYDLLVTDDPSEATEIAAKLSRLNTQRQQLVNEQMERIHENLGSTTDVWLGPPVVIVIGNWISGINGLLASKIVDTYKVPAFVGNLSQDQSTVIMSARGLDGIKVDQLLEQIANSYPHLLSRFGGHESAAGLSLPSKNYFLFAAALQMISKPAPPSKLLIDVKIDITDVNLDLAEHIQQLAPFGAGFSEPLFLSTVTVNGLIELGAKKGYKLFLRESAVDCLLFHVNSIDFGSGSVLDIVYNLQVDEYRGVKKPQVLIRDWRIHL